MKANKVAMVVQKEKRFFGDLFCCVAFVVFAFTICTGMLLSSIVSADDFVVDEINITVPVSCTLSGTGMDSHNANINNGLYVPDIGTTTLRAFCNDNEGFAIYAAGYTGDEVGGTNSDKLVGTTASGNATIDSGIATTAGNPDISNWAMKLTATQDSGDTTGTNAFTIDSAPNVDLPSQAEQSATQASFSQYHVVPNEYTKVAHKNSNTDMTESTGGVKLTTTYAAYISKTQAADTYSGQVIYTLVHPASRPAPGSGIQVTYDGDGMKFSNGTTANQVEYITNCDTNYIGNTPDVSKTPNVNDDGSAASGYEYYSTQIDPITFSGAERLKVVIDYGLDESYDYLYVFEGNYSGEVTDGPMEAGQIATITGGRGSGNTRFVPGESTTLCIDGDTVTLVFSSANYDENSYYGYYAKIYPIYTTQQNDTSAIKANCSIVDSVGAYQEPNHFKGSWKVGKTTLVDEEAVKAYIIKYSDEIVSDLIVVAANPYAIVYEGNSSDAGTMDGFFTFPDPLNPYDINGINNTVDLMAPNYKKTGYGFAGWSENPNATVNGSDTIYGPNQNINANMLSFDQDNDKSAVLYAVWVQSAGNMQSFSCDSLNLNQVTALTDIRDNNVYAVGKLVDGNCWMMENLRMDNAAVIDSSNTNNPGPGFVSLAQSTDVWCHEGSESCINGNRINTNNTNINGINASNSPLINGPGQYNGSNADGGVKGDTGDSYSWYSYGNYYTWYTATAGTGTYSAETGNVSGSICPSGWMLPSGWQSDSDKGQFKELAFAMDNNNSFQYTGSGSNKYRTYPANFVYSGNWVGSAAERRGMDGSYWSRTAIKRWGVRYLSFSNNGIGSDNSFIGGQSGAAVRCLALGS